LSANVIPQERELLLRQIDTAVRAGNIPVAAQIAERALAAGVEHPGVMNLAAHMAVERGEVDRGIALLERARALAPRDVHVLNSLGIALKRAGRFADAAGVFDAAIAADPRYSNAHFNKGTVLEALGELDHARAAYEQALVLEPNFPDVIGRLSYLAAMRGDYDAAADLATRAMPDAPNAALLNLAEFAIQRGDHAAARSLAERALAGAPDDPSAILVTAKAEVAAGDDTAAKARVDAFLARSQLEGDARALALHLVGRIEERAQNFPAAFAAFAESKAEIGRNHAARYAPGGNTTVAAAQVANATAVFSRAERGQWTGAPDAAGPALREHVFLVGFPRSGTTLLEKALAAHPGIVTLEEEETLAHVQRDFFVPPDGPARLAALPDAALAPYRAGYWRMPREAAPALEGKVFVDKMPLNAMFLPFIARLFPRAKILFALRDPRDVVLSCFRQQFTLSASMYEFSSLESTARFYDSVMRLAEIGRRLISLPVLETRYEDMVTDFDAATRKVAEFLGIEWIAAMRDVAASSRNRAVTTPSAPQLARGLYDGSGQWRNYATEMAPVLPVLAPWVAKFGYAPG
jgi:Tfp pilus assembly protein PilF